MARLAVFASGNGSNFEVIASALKTTNHSLEFLVCNKKSAFALERAQTLKVQTYLVSYKDRPREEPEAEILAHCRRHAVDLIALAGFMKLLSPYFLTRFQGEILNLHPALLPRHPGVDAIRRSVEAGDPEVGISIIRVDDGCDTGPIVFQESFRRAPDDTFETIEEKIHRLEHDRYPRVVIEILDRIDLEKKGTRT